MHHLPHRSRRPHHSLLQSGLAQILRAKALQENRHLSFLAVEDPLMQALNAGLKNCECGKPFMAGVEGIPDVGLQCLALLQRYYDALAHGRHDEAESIRRNKLEQSPCDVHGWVRTLLEYMDYYDIKKRQPHYVTWKTLDDFVYPLPETGKNGKTLTIGILGDWGTGTPGAETVLQDLMQYQPDLILHLGDIYYAGMPDECHHNFLAILCKYAPLTPIYTLPGNHEYFSGGDGFYSVLPKLNQLPDFKWVKQQQAGFFCLKNSWLHIQGMDTGYGAHNFPKEMTEPAPQLHPKEAEWQVHQIRESLKDDPGRRMILLSHHQPYSAYADVDKVPKSTGGHPQLERFPLNRYLLELFKEPLANRKITAWLWGHAHVYESYNSPIKLPDPINAEYHVLGRCLGNSGFPVLTSEAPYTVKSEALDQYVNHDPAHRTGISKDGEIYNHGYVVLELSPAEGRARYYEVDGGNAQPLGLKNEDVLYQAAQAVTVG